MLSNFFFILIDRIPDGVTLSALEPEHAKVLKNDWAKQSNADELEGYFRSVIEKFESSCLLDKNGRILAYICMQYNGSIAMIYVLPEFRKEGYFDILISDLTRKLLAKSDIAYGFIPFNDTSLINTSRKLGYEWVPQGNMTWTRFTPNVPRKQRQKAASESQVVDVFPENLDTLLKNQLGVPLVNIWRGIFFLPKIVMNQDSISDFLCDYCYVDCYGLYTYLLFLFLFFFLNEQNVFHEDPKYLHVCYIFH